MTIDNPDNPEPESNEARISRLAYEAEEARKNPAPGNPAVPAPEDTPPATPPPAPATPPDSGAGGSKAEGVFNLSEFLGGRFKSPEEISAELSNLDKLKSEVETLKSGPRFPSEKSKRLYEFAAKHEGMEPEAAMSYLKIQSLDLAVADPKELRFEAFKLDPSNSGLKPNQVLALFNENEKQFEAGEDQEGLTELQEARAIQATNAAKKVLGELQKSYSESSVPVTKPEDIAAARETLKSSVVDSLAKSGNKLTVQVKSVGPDGKELVSDVVVPLEQNELGSISSAAFDLQSAFTTKAFESGAVDDKGEIIDASKYAMILANITNPEALQRAIYKQGIEDGIANHIESLRNPGPSGGEGGRAPAAPVGTKKPGEAAHAYFSGGN